MSKVNQAVALVVQVDPLGGDVRAEQEPHGTLGIAEVLHDTLLLDIAHAAVERLDLAGLEHQVRGEPGAQPVQGGDAFGEDDEAVGRLGGTPVERPATLDAIEQRLVLGVVGWLDPHEGVAERRQGRDLGSPGRGVLPIRDLPLPPLDALVDGLDARRRTGKERLFESHREQVARRRFRPATGDPDCQQRVVRRFLGRGCGKPLREHLPVLERIAHLFLHVLLEATDHQTGPEVLPGVVVRVR